MRDYAARRNLNEMLALELVLKEKAEEFKKAGAEVCRKDDRDRIAADGCPRVEMSLFQDRRSLLLKNFPLAKNLQAMGKAEVKRRNLLLKEIPLATATLRRAGGCMKSVAIAVR